MHQYLILDTGATISYDRYITIKDLLPTEIEAANRALQRFYNRTPVTTSITCDENVISVIKNNKMIILIKMY